MPPGEDSRIAVSARVVPDHHDIDPAAAEAVLGTAPPSSEAASNATDDAPPEAEENIYEVMKKQMRLKQEEADAKWAAGGQQRKPGASSYGRPQPAPQPAAAPPPIEKITDLTNTAALWAAARQFLAHNARLLESVLGSCTSVCSVTATPPEIMLEIPNTQRNFTNDRAKAKLEEALRAVTGLPLKLNIDFVEPAQAAPHLTQNAELRTQNSQAAQRVPPEIVKAVNDHPLIQKLQTMLDANVTQIEIVSSAEEEAS